MRLTIIKRDTPVMVIMGNPPYGGESANKGKWITNQPAQRWLKDRKGRELSFDDILHYQKMIVALNETDMLMKEIDKLNFE